MAAISFYAFFILLIIFLLQSMEVESQGSSSCSRRFRCGNFGEMKFPFFSTDMLPSCGIYRVNCTGEIQKIQLEKGGRWYKIESISQSNNLVITDLELQESLNRNNCEAYVNSSLPSSNWLIFKDPLILFRCNRSQIRNLQGFNCKQYNFYYPNQNDTLSQSSPSECLKIQLPEKTMQRNATFTVELKVPGQCYNCHYREGRCSTNNEEQFECVGGTKVAADTDKPLKLGLGLGIGFALLTIISLTVLIIKCRNRRGSAEFHSRDMSNDPYSKSDIEGGNVYFKVPIFSYKVLSEATNNFNSDNLLGDGGYGTVYYGKLHDGREVAVKRLYQHNYRRVEQFINEIEILARLQHRNLVSLYGCTSRRSRDLLLVYEFVPHGTVADHLHGDPAKQSLLPWSNRMSIAVETASALCYLHASDIIHRDVKTNNILLDRNFSVKVADFGLSRLFPNDVTHVSTAPQGTPGYVDPEYYQCYHLTDKSDVYSFGVVLIELISSMPAVDINRHKHEINLSNLAITKIQKHALHELIDENLGYDTDKEVRSMIKMVAELAFRCLQQDNEMRPTMDEVLKELERIQNGEFKLEDQEENCDDSEAMKTSKLPPSARDGEEATLLKNIILPPSPISVAEKWISRSTTPNTSGWSSISFEAGNSKSSRTMEKPHS